MRTSSVENEFAVWDELGEPRHIETKEDFHRKLSIVRDNINGFP
jgi:hypothetical protein